MTSYILATIGFLGGLLAAALSFTANIVTGEHMATIAVVGLLFAATLGIWHIASTIDDYLKKRDKRELALYEQLQQRDR